MENLKDEFQRDIWKSYYDTRNETGYNPEYFRQMLEELGGLETAKRLLSSEKLADGFTKLWELRRLDLTVEALVIQDRYKELFTEQELETAKTRLEALGYNFMYQLKDIKYISIDEVITSKDKDNFIKNDDIKIIGVERVENYKLKLFVEDKQMNNGFTYINALNNQGKNILDDIQFSNKIIGVPLCVLPKLDLGYFKHI